MERKNQKKSIIGICLLFFCLLTYLTSCERIYTVQGKVFTISGEALPGVCVSSPEILKHTITNAKGNFTFRLSKPISKLEFIKSDYLPFVVPVYLDNTTIVLPDIFLTPKPSVPGVYFLIKEKNMYKPLMRGKIERTQIEKQNSVPSVRLDEIVQVEEKVPSIYVFRLPPYDLVLYRMKEYIDKKEDIKSDKKTDKSDTQSTPTGKDHVEREKRIWVPDEPVLTYSEFLSEMDTSLFLIKPVKELKPGVYCINWRAFEVPFPKMNECFLFSVQEEKVDKSSPETFSSSVLEDNDKNKK